MAVARTLSKKIDTLLEEAASDILSNSSDAVKKHFKDNWGKYAAGAGAVGLGAYGIAREEEENPEFYDMVNPKEFYKEAVMNQYDAGNLTGAGAAATGLPASTVGIGLGHAINDINNAVGAPIDIDKDALIRRLAGTTGLIGAAPGAAVGLGADLVTALPRTSAAAGGAAAMLAGKKLYDKNKKDK